MTTLQCISPIDGSVFATRETLDEAAAFAAAGRARAAQAAWAARPLEERAALVMAGVAAVGAMNDDVVPELAHMMGRPVRYGGEFGGFNERASHMAAIGGEALADIAVGCQLTQLALVAGLPDASRWPALVKAVQSMQARPEFAANLEVCGKMLAGILPEPVNLS